MTISMPRQLRWVNFDFNKQIEGDLSDLKGLERLASQSSFRKPFGGAPAVFHRHLQCANFIHSPKITGDLRQRPNIQRLGRSEGRGA